MGDVAGKRPRGDRLMFEAQKAKCIHSRFSHHSYKRLQGCQFHVHSISLPNEAYQEECSTAPIPVVGTHAGWDRFRARKRSPEDAGRGEEGVLGRRAVGGIGGASGLQGTC